MLPTSDPRRGEAPPFAVLHLPHASTEIPADVVPSFCISKEELTRELRLMTDAFTDRLFRLPPAVARTVAFPVSRLVVDPERFEDDADEPMAHRGMGVLYSRTRDLRALRKALNATQRAELLNRFYHPHHRRLSGAVSDALRACGNCLIVDGHSFPSAPLPYEEDQRPDRPAVCIGTDRFHTPDWLEETATTAFGSAGWEVEVNRPFAGAIVPAERYETDERVWSVMIEIRRDLYMDEGSGRRRRGFEAVRAGVEAGVSRILDAASARLGGRS